MDKVLLTDVIKKASVATNLDSQNRCKEAYNEYLECLCTISNGLLQVDNEATDDQRNVPVSKSVRQIVRVGQQCMDRVAAILDQIQESAPKSETMRESELKVTASPSEDVPHASFHTTRYEAQIPPLPDDPNCFPHKRMTKPLISPIEGAIQRNYQLATLYTNRMATMSHAAAANLNLTLQRKMAENLAIAQAREEVIIKRIRERQNRLEEAAVRRFSSTFGGMSEEDKEYRHVYKRVLEYEQDAKWLIAWRHKLRMNAKEPSLIRDTISEILKCSDHPLTQLLKSYQYKVYERIYPLVAQNFPELDKVSVPLNDVYWLSALDICARNKSLLQSKEKTEPDVLVQNKSENSIHDVPVVDSAGKNEDTLPWIPFNKSEVIDDAVSAKNGMDKSTVDQSENVKCKGEFYTKDNVADTNGQVATDSDATIKMETEENTIQNNADRNCGLLQFSDNRAKEGDVMADINENAIDHNARYNVDDSELVILSNVYNTKNKLSLEFLKAKQAEERMIKDIRKTTEEIYDEIMSGDDLLPDFSPPTSPHFRNESQKSETNPSNSAIQFDNLADDDFVKMSNDAYARHLEVLKNDVHCYMEKIVVMFIVAYEDLDSPEGRDLTYAYLEVPFFTPLWKYILALFRLCNLQKELCVAVAMSEYPDTKPEELDVKETLLLAADPYPYQAAVQQLHSFVKWATPLSKLESLVSVTQSICQCIDEYYSHESLILKKPAVGADELIPIMSYVVMSSCLPQIVSECHALEEFVHEGYLMGEEGYCLTSLQTATNYIVSLGARILQQRMAATT